LEQALKAQASLKNNGRFKSQRRREQGKVHGNGQGGREHFHEHGGRGNGNNALNNKEGMIKARGRGCGYS